MGTDLQNPKSYTPHVAAMVQFFAERYPEAVLTKVRKREVVLLRRMIVHFLYYENKMRLSTIKYVVGKSHQVAIYFLKPIKDIDFDVVYRRETAKFRDEYFAIFPKSFHEKNA